MLLRANRSCRFSTWDAAADQKEENNVISKMMWEDREDLRKMLREMDELEEEGNSPLNFVYFGTQKVTKKPDEHPTLTTQELIATKASMRRL